MLETWSSLYTNEIDLAPASLSDKSVWFSIYDTSFMQ
jgi:hypothetical protein